MAANTLGTLTLDLVAKIGGFVEPLSRAERAAKKSFDGIGASVNSLGEYSDKATKEMAKLAQQMEDQFHDIGSAMQREIALYGEVSRAAKLRYDLEKGNLRSMSAEQKASLMDMARRLDMMDSANEAFMANTKAVDANGRAYRGARGMAQNFGWQMQDVVVQLQMGTDAFVVFSQQGSQLASAFNPMLGLFIALGGVIGGVLFRSIMETNKAIDEMGDNALSLAGDMSKLNDAQKEVIRTALIYSQIDLSKQLDEQAKSIGKLKGEIDALNESNGRRVTLEVAVNNGLDMAVELHKNAASAIKGFAIEAFEFQQRLFTGQVAFDPAVEINNTDKLAEAKKKLTAIETLRIKTLEDLRKVQDPSGSNDVIKKLAEEVSLVGLSGRAYWELKATQEGLSGINKQLYIDLNLLREAKEKNIESDKKSNESAKEASEKAAKDVQAVEEATKKLISQMERENALFSETSKAAQMKYDIENGIIKVAGGIDGVNAKRLIELATVQDTNKAREDSKKTIDDILKKLKEEELQVSQTAKEYVRLQLANAGADQPTIDAAMARMNRIEEAKAAKKEMEDMAKRTEEMWNRVDEAASNAWENMFSGAKNSFDGIKSIFRKMLAEMAHDAITKPILMQVKDTFTPWIDNLKKTLASSLGGGAGGKGGGGKGGGMLGFGALGVWGMAAVGVAAAVSSFNKKQDEIARKMSAEYRQSTQSLGTILGESGKKSESIAKSISILSEYANDTLSVNYQMYQALLDIREGIGGVAAGFARQFGLKGGVGDFSGIKQGTFAGAEWANFKGATDFIKKNVFFGGDAVTNFIDDFMTSLVAKVNKEIYKKKTKVIDSGISFIGQTLADILASGTVNAFSYAEIQTQKKFLGVTTSNKVKTQLGDLDAILLGQFADIFSSAGKALEQIAPTFGKDFANIISSLKIDTKKLSLKDLEGDALVKEIEAFFSSTLDNWASVLADGTGVLERFQKVGEGAFETVVRLASETAYFIDIADKMNLRFDALGASAIVAAQGIADAAGGFDALGKSLSVYYREFFDEQERAENQFSSLSKRMKELGVDVVPKTRDAFRGIIEGLNLTVEADQKRFAALIGLSGAVDQYIESLDAEAKARESARQKLKDAVGTAFDTFSAAVQRDMDVINKALESSRDLVNSVSGALKSMNLESSRSDLMTRRAAQAQVVSATAIARSGGPLPSAASLEGALSVLAQPSQDLFSSFEEYARDFYATKRNLEALEAQANTQVSIDEKNLAALEKSLDYYQKQVDLLNGIDKGVVGVAEAMNRLTNAFSNAGVILPSQAAPVIQTVTPVAIAADNIANNNASSQVSTVQSLPDIVEMLKAFAEDMSESQFSIAKYSMDSKKILEKWDTEGLPQERDYT